MAHFFGCVADDHGRLKAILYVFFFISFHKHQQPYYIQGDELWDELVVARQRGDLLARKFSSDSVVSVQLMHEIQEYMQDSD